MNDLNLVPQELKAAEELKKKRTQTTLIVLLTLFLFAAFSCIPFYLINQIKDQNTNVEGQINQLSDVKKQVDMLNQQKIALQGKLNIFNSLTKQENMWSDIINEIAKLSPQDISIINFTGQKDSVTLQCSSQSIQSIAVFYANLENSSVFSGLKINDITPVNEGTTFSFNLILDLKNSEGKVN